LKPKVDANEYGEVFQMDNVPMVRLTGEDFGLAYLIDGVVFRLTSEEVAGIALPKLTPMNISDEEWDSMMEFCLDNDHEQHELAENSALGVALADMKSGLDYEDRYIRDTASRGEE